MAMNTQVLESLRKNVENTDDGWGDVYLDNARPAGMSDKSFRSHLAALAKRDLYKPIDGYAFGRVKLEEPKLGSVPHDPKAGDIC